MTKLLQNKKRMTIIGVCLLCIIAVAITILNPFNKITPHSGTSSSSTLTNTSNAVVVEAPVTDTQAIVTENSTNAIVDDGSGLTPKDNKSENSSTTAGKKAHNNTSPVDSKSSGNNSGKNSGGIQIGGGDKPTKYSCGSPKHHCDSPETHAYILNLESKGCPYCGSHSCPSFYGVDKWGNAGYFPKLCPKYDIKKDPVYYCQTCGRKTGDGKNGTCVQFVNDCNCPNCGKFVKARTCHTCK